MEPHFWHERWESGQRGFHQTEVNALLESYWPRLGLPAEASIFVPLCGEALDPHWLHESGFVSWQKRVQRLVRRASGMGAESGRGPTR